jgi:hypothetical protein
LEYLIKQYPLERGALEIQYIEEFFGEFPRKKTADEITNRLQEREFLILMAEAPLPDDPGTVVPVSFKVVHQLHAIENEPKLRDLVQRLQGCVRFDDRKVLYSWIGGTDMRGTLDQLEFDVVKYEVNAADNRESKVYLSKRLTSDVVRAHRSTRTVVYAD